MTLRVFRYRQIPFELALVGLPCFQRVAMTELELEICLSKVMRAKVLVLPSRPLIDLHSDPARHPFIRRQGLFPEIACRQQ